MVVEFIERDGAVPNRGAPSPITAPPLAITDIHTVDALEALVPEWADLWRRATTATPFQAPAWLVPWWRHFGDGAALRTLALRAHGRLVGLVPLLLYRKRLLPLGIDTSDYLDALLDDGLGPEALGAVFAHLDQQTDWTVCDLPDLPAGSPLLGAPVPAGWTDRRTRHDVCPLLALPARLDALPGILPPTIARKLRMYRRRAAAAGTVTVATAGPDDAAALFDALVELHGARWQARGESGVLDEPDALAFHREAAPAMAALGALRLSALRLDGRTIAVIYGFAAGRRVCYYLQGFDPAFADLGPGNLIVGHAVEAAVSEGATDFDFLRGSEDYKYRWGARDQVTWRRRLGRPQRRRPPT